MGKRALTPGVDRSSHWRQISPFPKGVKKNTYFLAIPSPIRPVLAMHGKAALHVYYGNIILKPI
jgi:hypothetical protein